MTFQINVSATVSAKVETSVSQNLTVGAALTWNGSALTSTATPPTNTFSFTPPTIETVSVSSFLHAQVSPRLTFMIYGVLGPYLQASIYLNWTSNSEATPVWTLTGGVALGGGIVLKITKPKKITFDKGNPKILTKYWLITESFTVVTKDLDSADIGVPYSQKMTAVGGTAP